jgi:hypothetical protein
VRNGLLDNQLVTAVGSVGSPDQALNFEAFETLH